MNFLLLLCLRKEKILPPLNAERIILFFMVDTSQHCEFLRVQSQGKSHWSLFIFAQRLDQVSRSSSAPHPSPRGWEASKHLSDISCVTGACSLWQLALVTGWECLWMHFKPETRPSGYFSVLPDHEI